MDRGCNEECSRGRERTDRRANTRTKHGRVNGIRGRWQSGSREGGRVLGPGEELHLEAAAGDEARHGVGAEPARNTPHSEGAQGMCEEWRTCWGSLRERKPWWNAAHCSAGNRSDRSANRPTHVQSAQKGAQCPHCARHNTHAAQSHASHTANETC
eukprot:2657537-Rhodomonas_salina.5